MNDLELNGFILLKKLIPTKDIEYLKSVFINNLIDYSIIKSYIDNNLVNYINFNLSWNTIYTKYRASNLNNLYFIEILLIIRIYIMINKRYVRVIQ